MRLLISIPMVAYFLDILFISVLFSIITAQITNNAPPYFIPGLGDMSRLNLAEDTPIDSPVYQLKGIDPDGGRLHYSISGPIFSIDRDTGVVRLRQKLDRENQNVVEVIISLTDESILGAEPNTISLRRLIPIIDYNDNAPIFIGRPYTANISELAIIGTKINVTPQIIITDRDEGLNADIDLLCFDDGSSEEELCETFNVDIHKIAEGNFSASLSLIKELDYETKPIYKVTLKARDKAIKNQLSAFVTVAIDIIDMQDEPPNFINAPYSATIWENTNEDTSILTVSAIDGDAGNHRSVLLTIEDEPLGHFKLETDKTNLNGTAILRTTNIPLDREHEDILQNGGVYTFTIKATELINNVIPADFSKTRVTIVVKDIDDNLPKFNYPEFHISIPENLEKGTSLPSLSIYVIDKDLGQNSQYTLSIRNIKNAKDVFTISPEKGMEQTPLVVKVLDPSKLDYDVEDFDLRTLKFYIVAAVNGTEVASTQITVNLQDSNDNAPIFDKQSYSVMVKENEPVAMILIRISAIDYDSDVFGAITYLLKGFGSDHFLIDPKTGDVSINKNLDYEQQGSYSLTVVALDGGNRETNANLFIEIIDVNDNYPIFENSEYTRTIREGTNEFEPQLIVRATDKDGPSQGGSNITYSLESENTLSGNVFSMNRTTGELKLRKPANSMDTERGQYELTVSATDHGYPALKNTTRIIIRVGISGNQRPIFKGHFQSNEKFPLNGPPSYRATIPESAKTGYNVTKVSATDPDGIDSLLMYRIVGANDNFEIDERSGLIQVSQHAQLDRDSGIDSFEIVVNAVDAGFPIPETATATVYVSLSDVNDKPPKFEKPSYIAYISERTNPGTEILQVQAIDSDLDAKLEYKISNIIKATSKSGVSVSDDYLDKIKNTFIIDHDTGQIFVNSSLNHDMLAIIILAVEVVDVNAVINKLSQKATTDVTIYIQSFKDTNPVFKNNGWTSSRPVVNIDIREESAIGGSALFILVAEDPITKRQITNFKIVHPDEKNFFILNERTGEVFLTKRLDYEALQKSYFTFQAKATSFDGTRNSITMVNVTINNINDNSPKFEQKEYRAAIAENRQYPEMIIKITAKDKDNVLNERDLVNGYNKIVYTLHGQYSNWFAINNITGEIIVAKDQIIDRESISLIKLIVKAEDTPGKPTESLHSTVNFFIEILDINDNPPKFMQESYTTVIPENSVIDSFVFKMNAVDPDEGPGGEIRYDFVNEDEISGLLKINSLTGEIKTKLLLTGKGRSNPYHLVVRAQDNGGQVPKQESLYNDVSLILYIGDVSANDGIPYFVSPKLGQTASVSENATIGSPVFQVVASDPDSPSTPSGKLHYSIQDDSGDSKSFRIDPHTGLITTLAFLDREVRDNYNIILEVSDNGDPRQSATRILKINILDIDDHTPRFRREVDSEAIEMSISEEEQIGTIVGMVAAFDEDIGENGSIDYTFVNGNEENLFIIQRTNDNKGIIKSNARIDRELNEYFRLTIKCFKYGTHSQDILQKNYNSNDLSLLNIIIQVNDIDDHIPEFDLKDPKLGIKVNVPIDTSIIVLCAHDIDPDALPISYAIQNITFVPQFYKRKTISKNLYKNLFILNNQTGELRTGGRLIDFVDGYFQMTILAKNSNKTRRFGINNIKIFVIRDKLLLRFIFTKPATEIQNLIDEFQNKVQMRLKSYNLELKIFDTQVLSKANHRLDFSSTSSCFQLFRNGLALPLDEMENIINSDELKKGLVDIYAEYGVTKIESCSNSLKQAASITSAGSWLVVLAALIGLGAIIATCTACCLATRYKKEVKKFNNKIQHEAFGAGTSVYVSEPIYGAL